MKKSSFWKCAVLITAAAVFMSGGAGAGIVSPRKGGPLPEGYLRTGDPKSRPPEISHRWIDSRKKYIRSEQLRIGSAAGALGSSLQGGALTGVLRMPVLCGVYSDYTETPVSTASLDRVFFTRFIEPSTVADYYTEVSGGRFTVDGTVRGWVQLPETEAYYTGGYAQGVDPDISKTNEMIAAIVQGSDASVDFGIYDNDGPDGIPNSGDDDGYVDVLVIVHPTTGGECGGTHMWSHSWRYSFWPGAGAPLETDDPAANGGHILVDDYIIGPAKSCGGGVIEIGVFCHELGHVLGLPDLYDTYGGVGIGHWGLMGNGNWNTPSSPAHLCGWSKEQLGWADIREVDWREQQISLEPSESGGEIVKMVLPTKRFRRRENIFPVTGNSMILGYTAAESSARGWPGGAGYGNGWHESIVHWFENDGSSPCTFGYNIATDIEPGYDYTYLILETSSGKDTLASYTGEFGPSKETIDLSGKLPPGGGSFALRFLFVSDRNISDEDARYDSQEGWTLNIDNVSLTGGGNSYYCDFESDQGGWKDDSAPAEYFLAEYRKREGFDAHLHGEGILIWHAENSIAYSDLGNTGGYTNSQARGVVLEEADGDYDLLATSNPPNYGDASDPFPGASNKTSFTKSTVPSSMDNGMSPTPVSITGISGSSGLFVAGMPAPSVDSVEPDMLSKTGGVLQPLDVSGAEILPGASCALARGAMRVEAVRVDWLGYGRISAWFDTADLYAGDWDLELTSGDGQTAALTGALEVFSVFVSAGYTVSVSDIRIDWEVDPAAGVTGCILERSTDGDIFEPLTQDTLRSGSGIYVYTDVSTQSGEYYWYRISAFYPGGEEAYDLPGPLVLERHFAFDLPRPNPFRDRCTIPFYTPDSRMVSADFYDISGRRVSSIGPASFERGERELVWEPSAEGIAAGVYLCVVKARGETRNFKVVYVP